MINPDVTADCWYSTQTGRCWLSGGIRLSFLKMEYKRLTSSICNSSSCFSFNLKKNKTFWGIAGCHTGQAFSLFHLSEQPSILRNRLISYSIRECIIESIIELWSIPLTLSCHCELDCVLATLLSLWTRLNGPEAASLFGVLWSITFLSSVGDRGKWFRPWR